jgi:hypothetical protein
MWDGISYEHLVNEESIPMQRAAKPCLLVVKKPAAPVLDVLGTIGRESIRNRKDTLSSCQIDRIIKKARTKKSER